MGRKEKPSRPSIYYVATKDTKTGTIYLKVVNVADHAQEITIDIKGAGTVRPTGKLIEIKGKTPEDTNTIDDPEKIVPATQNVTGVAKVFTRAFPPYSVSVLKIQTTGAK
jgi:alpha-L-arabinofuranosidase